MKALHKVMFHRSWNSDGFELNFAVFVMLLGALLMNLRILEGGLKYHGFFRSAWAGGGA